MNTITVKTPYAVYPDCHITLNNYAADGSLCVELWNEEDGMIARLTTCLSKKSLKGTNRSYVDDNNCPWAMDLIEKYNLGTDTEMIGMSGFCFYPLVEWNIDELKKYA